MTESSFASHLSLSSTLGLGVSPPVLIPHHLFFPLPSLAAEPWLNLEPELETDSALFSLSISVRIRIS